MPRETGEKITVLPCLKETWCPVLVQPGRGKQISKFEASQGYILRPKMNKLIKCLLVALTCVQCTIQAPQSRGREAMAVLSMHLAPSLISGTGGHR